jgi:hypothetical protein
VEPFKVFISSSQKEFERLRKNLKERIDAEELVRQRIMRAILIEEKKGTGISEDIEKGIKDSSIYVGIFGRVYSEWTVQEFRKARDRILPLLIYRFPRLSRRGRPRQRAPRGRRSKVYVFLEDEVKRVGIRIRGPYTSESALEKAVMTDLAFQVAEMVREAATVRKTISE